MYFGPRLTWIQNFKFFVLAPDVKVTNDLKMVLECKAERNRETLNVISRLPSWSWLVGNSSITSFLSVNGAQIDVLWGQRIKLIQVVSTSEFDQY